MICDKRKAFTKIRIMCGYRDMIGAAAMQSKPLL